MAVLVALVHLHEYAVLPNRCAVHSAPYWRWQAWLRSPWSRLLGLPVA